MKYTYNGVAYNIPDATVDKLVDNLGISIADACELWLADNGKIDNSEQDALEEVAKTGKRRYEKSATQRKTATKERKIDNNKLFLLKIVENALKNCEDCSNFSLKNEVELNFDAFGNNFTLKLTRHRPKK